MNVYPVLVALRRHKAAVILIVLQIALTCALGYADFRYADYPWRSAFPNLAAFDKKMMQRVSISSTVPE